MDDIETLQNLTMGYLIQEYITWGRGGGGGSVALRNDSHNWCSVSTEGH